MLRPTFVGKVASRVCFPWTSTLRPVVISSHQPSISRGYAVLGKLEGSPKGSKPSHKKVTVTNDDGRVPWNELSTGEKAARTTQQSFNFGIVLAGAVGTV